MTRFAPAFGMAMLALPITLLMAVCVIEFGWGFGSLVMASVLVAQKTDGAWGEMTIGSSLIGILGGEFGASWWAIAIGGCAWGVTVAAARHGAMSKLPAS